MQATLTSCPDSRSLCSKSFLAVARLSSAFQQLSRRVYVRRACASAHVWVSTNREKAVQQQTPLTLFLVLRLSSFVCWLSTCCANMATSSFNLETSLKQWLVYRLVNITDRHCQYFLLSGHSLSPAVMHGLHGKSES